MWRIRRLLTLFSRVVPAVLLLSACQPIQAPSTTLQTATPLTEALAGKYQGTEVSLGGFFGGTFASDYRESLRGFSEATGINVNYDQVTQDDLAFQAMITAGTGPDIAMFGYLSPVKRFAQEGKVVDLNLWIDPATLQAQVDAQWLDLATMTGPDGPIMAGVWSIYSLNSLVWYPKTAFDAAGYTVPTTWEEMLTLSDQMVEDGGTPWCIEDLWEGGALGFPATQWVGDLLLRTAPPADYTAWMNGELPFTSPQVKHAVQLMGDFFSKPGYVLGGREAINRMTMFETSQAMLAAPPKCWMIKEPSWILDWDGVSDVTIFDKKAFGADYAFFVLPPIDANYGAPIQVEGNLYAMFQDRPEVRALMEYLATGADVEAWVKQGRHFGVTPHKGAQLDWYPQTRERAIASAGMDAQQAGDLYYIAGEAMWPTVNSQFYQSMADYVAGKVDLDTALQQIDAVAQAVDR